MSHPDDSTLFYEHVLPVTTLDRCVEMRHHFDLLRGYVLTQCPNNDLRTAALATLHEARMRAVLAIRLGDGIPG